MSRSNTLISVAASLLAMGLSTASHAATSAAPSTCGGLAGTRFVFEVQGKYDTGYNALPFAEVGRLVFDATGATGTTSSYTNGPGDVATHPSTSFSCADLSLPKGFAKLTFADGRAYNVVANNHFNLLKMIRVDAHTYAGGEARLSTDWSTLPAQACSLLGGKAYISSMVGSILVDTPTTGAYSAFADVWSFTNAPGKLSGVWEFGANTPAYHAESGTRLDCAPYDDGSAIVTWTDPAGFYENSFVIYPNADGSSAAALSTLPGQGAAGWLVKR
ncbi:MAG TPA: hypothetical protein VLA61_27015 [Ideonella sp.]|uniref:hypothetical protein n=1 Tax=Ideonella sp. TaxID=1929293 RepID=UPI002D07875D|nr:hypothetical protein [Ideonella sp.]HSI51932.1 hypothetical protein [Ideonella sp.]